MLAGPRNYFFTNNFGSFATFAAIRHASSLRSNSAPIAGRSLY
jgi:hypothetical protein